MKAAYLIEATIQQRNFASAADVYKNVAIPVLAKDGKAIQYWRIPKGTVVEGDEAILRVQNGHAEPVDDECAKACGMSPAELSATQRSLLSAEAGIRGDGDYALFMDGVIDGYLPGSTDAKPIYKPGRKWDAYQAELAKKKAEDQ